MKLVVGEVNNYSKYHTISASQAASQLCWSVNTLPVQLKRDFDSLLFLVVDSHICGFKGSDTEIHVANGGL